MYTYMYIYIHMDIYAYIKTCAEARQSGWGARHVGTQPRARLPRDVGFGL